MDELFSRELLKRMERLTVKQRRAIPLIVRARGEGRPWEQILKGEGKVCNWRTFWDGKRGWYHQELFREVLGQAQREYDAAVLRTSVQDAAEGLRRAAPLATELLQVLVARARAMVAGETVETGEAGQVLRDLLADEKAGVRVSAAGRLLRVRAQAETRGARAAVAVLDRADIETAVKGVGGAEERFAALLAELRGEDVGE